jgi:coenzyme Q-binding protein COQ10
MPTHAETRVLPYAPQELYDLVADVKRYPEFLPWVSAVRIRRETETGFTADVMVGYKMFREKFTSDVTLGDRRIQVAYRSGPMRHLHNHWIFNDHPAGTEIEFFVDFEFRSRLLQGLVDAFFNEAVRRMVNAFEARARDLYGPRELPAGSGLSQQS